MLKPACAREVAWRRPVGMDKGRGLPAGRRSSETTIKNYTDMNFIKTFLAGVLAFVVGCFLVCYIGMMMLVSLAGSFEQAVTVPEGSILEINLDEVSKKYDGLDGTELAISESQERMAVVVSPADAEAFKKFADEENLECKLVAKVTDSGRLVMKWRGKEIVSLTRAFLDTNGTTATATAQVEAPSEKSPLEAASGKANDDELAWLDMLRNLNCASQRGLIERFDSSIGAGTVVHPFGGKNLATPPEAMCAKIPLLKGDTNTGTLFSFGFNPYVSEWSPYHGAQYAMLESVAKIAASGGDVNRIRFTFQEYFEKLRGNPARWGKPLAALLGAFEGQMEMGCASIGGKDSMSGSFNNIDVPPTLVSFAMCPCDVRRVISPEFKKAGSRVAIIEIERNADLTPNWKDAMKKYAALAEAMKHGKVLSAHSVRFGGVAEAVAKMAFGNGIGFAFDAGYKGDVFKLNYGAILIEMVDGISPTEMFAKQIGETIAEGKIKIGKAAMDLSVLCEAWGQPLENIFPTQAAASQDGKLLKPSFEPKNIAVAPSKVAKPKVFIPVFPGTNCEYDTAKAFNAAGAEASTFVFRNMSDKDVAESIAEMKRRIDAAQILMLPGGFSAGDEPAGSGKFIAAVFRNAALSDAVMSLLKDRKGLILGICNGFQALIKLGLVPFGEIRELREDSPTLTYNNISRHVSCYVRTRVASRLSPWLADCALGEEHVIPVSHGEGKFIAPESVISKLAANGQIATQYVDASGNPSAVIPFNPNGSMHAVEGITSPCGLVFGKMAHTERFGTNVGKNITGNKIQPLFSAGVKYFK